MTHDEIEQALATSEWQRHALLKALEFMLDRFEGREGNLFSQRLACTNARDAIAAQLAATPVAASEVVEYQCRMRPKWHEAGEGWTKWEKFSAETYLAMVEKPPRDDWQYEVRKLYAAPVAAPAPDLGNTDGRPPAQPTDQQIVDTLARHGIGWGNEQGVTAYPLDGEDAPIYIGAIREILAAAPVAAPGAELLNTLLVSLEAIQTHPKSFWDCSAEIAAIREAIAAAPVADLGNTDGRSAAPVAAQEPTMVCSQCGADRFKEDCKGDRMRCDIRGTAQSSPPAPSGMLASQPAQGERVIANPKDEPTNSHAYLNWAMSAAKPAEQPAQGERQPEKMLRAILIRPDLTPEGREQFIQDVLSGRTELTIVWDDICTMANVR